MHVCQNIIERMYLFTFFMFLSEHPNQNTEPFPAKKFKKRKTWNINNKKDFNVLRPSITFLYL